MYKRLAFSLHLLLIVRTYEYKQKPKNDNDTNRHITIILSFYDLKHLIWYAILIHNKAVPSATTITRYFILRTTIMALNKHKLQKRSKIIHLMILYENDITWLKK